MWPTCIMMQHAHKAKQTITGKGDSCWRQEVLDEGEAEEEAVCSGWAGRMNEYGRNQRIREWIKRWTEMLKGQQRQQRVMRGDDVSGEGGEGRN